MKSVVNYNFRNLNMNNIYKETTGIIGMMCLLSLSVVFTSCSSDDDEPQNTEQNTDGRKLRQLTIAEVPITRAILTDQGSTIGATWKENDETTYFNLSSFTPNNIDRGTLTANSSTSTSSFTGGVVCREADQIALIYPTVSIDETSNETTRGTFTINLSGQAGTLADIAEHFHYVYGVGEVTSVTETTATATISPMKSLLAVCKFTFNDGSNTIPVKRLSIGYADEVNNTLYKSGYPLTGTVNPFKKVNEVTTIVPIEDISVTANSPSDYPLTFDFSNGTSDVVYAALFPVSGQLLHFTVTNDADTYTGTATATLKAGKFYNVNLKLN